MGTRSRGGLADFHGLHWLLAAEKELRGLELVLQDVDHRVGAPEHVLAGPQQRVARVLRGREPREAVARVVKVCGLAGLVPKAALGLLTAPEGRIVSERGNQ
jgi:hypothetical protein